MSHLVKHKSAIHLFDADKLIKNSRKEIMLEFTHVSYQ